MKQPERYLSRHFIPELIEDEDIIFNKDSNITSRRRKRRILFLKEISPKKDGRFEEVQNDSKI